jgi:hypothetical protein
MRDLASILGRNQGPELFATQAFVPLTSPLIPDFINLNRPMERLHIILRARIIIAVAALTVVFPEALPNLIQRIRLTGTHRRFGAQVPLDIIGATAFRMSNLFRNIGSQAGVLAGGIMVYGGDSSDAQANTSIFSGAIGNHDVEIHYEIPLVPIVATAAKLTTIPFLYMERDWGNTLKLQLTFADGTSLGTFGAGTTVAFQQFGGGAGTTATVEVLTNYEILGPVSESISPAVVVRAESPVTGIVTGVAAAALQLQRLENQKTTNIFLKIGTIPAGLSAGVSAFLTLVDTILEQTQVLVDNKPLRNTSTNRSAKLYAGYAFNTLLPSGYLNFPFCDSQNPLTYFRGDLLSGAAKFELRSQVLTAGVTQAVQFVQEKVLGDPQGNG